MFAGLVCSHFSDFFTRSGAVSLDKALKESAKPGIWGLDTRALVLKLRQKGTMNALISDDVSDLAQLRKRLSEYPSMTGLELASKVSTESPYSVGDPQSPLKVAALDLGVKKSILDELTRRGCHVRVFPAKSGAKALFAFEADGFLAGNGPGDPAATGFAVQTVKDMLKTGLPFMGICLGHQLLALACGAKTEKLLFGHHGVNHPVMHLATQRCEITSQNHGFTVNENSLSSTPLEITHRNLNDQSVEGLRHKNLPAFSVQYHPESSPGPHDSKYLFDHFVELMRKRRA
jgi:carbamoyl-phosphate synthase small subunit